MQSLAPLIAESERVIAEAIKHFGLKISPDQIILTAQTKGRMKAYGWFAPKRWADGKEIVHEINLSAEYLNCKERDMADTLLHELAHAENEFLGIKDVSGNQMHNKKFKAMAEKIGMEVGPRDKSHGFYRTQLNEEGKEFLKKIGFKRELFTMFRTTPMAAAAKGSRLMKLECGGCGYVIRTTMKWIDQGVPTCHCGEEFSEA